MDLDENLKPYAYYLVDYLDNKTVIYLDVAESFERGAIIDNLFAYFILDSNQDFTSFKIPIVLKNTKSGIRYHENVRKNNIVDLKIDFLEHLGSYRDFFTKNKLLYVNIQEFLGKNKIEELSVLEKMQIAMLMKNNNLNVEDSYKKNLFFKNKLKSFFQ